VIRRATLASVVVLACMAAAALPAHAVDPPFTGSTRIDAGGSHSCVTMISEQVRCWGANEVGQLGVGGPSDHELPVNVADTDGIGPLGSVRQVVTGDRHSCALLVTTRVYCWGEGDEGRLGTYGVSGVDRPRPILEVSLHKEEFDGVVQIAAGWAHTCALLDTSEVACWGRSTSGQIGNGSLNPAPYPRFVLARTGNARLTGITSIAAGAFHTCARMRDGTARCWGENEGGGIGDGTFTDRRRPAVVLAATGSAPLRGVVALTGGASSTCALVQGGQVRCWGYNASRQLGMTVASTANRARPVVVRVAGAGTVLTGVTQVSGSSGAYCARRTNGEAWCWGGDNRGQRGDGPHPRAAGARPVLNASIAGAGPPGPGNLRGVLGVSGGHEHACARIQVPGEVRVACWGDNLTRQIGAGSVNGTFPRPTTVLAAPEQSE
jgi:alpha-tubulin suppressor-like RCC1 family protein